MVTYKCTDRRAMPVVKSILELKIVFSKYIRIVRVFFKITDTHIQDKLLHLERMFLKQVNVVSS